MPDLLIRVGTIVTPEGLQRADLAIEDGLIAALAPELPGGGREIEAAGLLILPGVIDVHLHFNEPGRAGAAQHSMSVPSALESLDA